MCLWPEHLLPLGGLSDMFPKQHKRLLNSLPAHSVSLLLRVWTGSPMTAYMRSRMYEGEIAECACGANRQDMYHLMYECPLLGDLPLELHAWKSLPLHILLRCIFSIPLTSPRSSGNLFARAIRVLSKLPAPRDDFNWREHQVHGDEWSICILHKVLRHKKDSRQ